MVVCRHIRSFKQVVLQVKIKDKHGLRFAVQSCPWHLAVPANQVSTRALDDCEYCILANIHLIHIMKNHVPVSDNKKIMFPVCRVLNIPSCYNPLILEEYLQQVTLLPC